MIITIFLAKESIHVPAYLIAVFRQSIALNFLYPFIPFIQELLAF